MATKGPLRHIGAAKAKAAVGCGPVSAPKHTNNVPQGALPSKLQKIWGGIPSASLRQ